MKEKEPIQLKTNRSNHPILMLTVCLACLAGCPAFFDWALAGGARENAAFPLAQAAIAAFLVGGAALALWRLTVTRWATGEGIVYRVLGKQRKQIPWSGFRHAIYGRSGWSKVELLYLIPADAEPYCGESSRDLHDYLTRYHYRAIRMDPTGGNIAALENFFGEVIR